MDFGEIYNFLFNTYGGVACLVGLCLVLSLLAAVIMERRTRKRFKHRDSDEQDSWSWFGDDSDDDDSDDDDDKEKK